MGISDEAHQRAARARAEREAQQSTDHKFQKEQARLKAKIHPYEAELTEGAQRLAQEFAKAMKKRRVKPIPCVIYRIKKRTSYRSFDKLTIYRGRSAGFSAWPLRLERTTSTFGAISTSGKLLFTNGSMKARGSNPDFNGRMYYKLGHPLQRGSVILLASKSRLDNVVIDPKKDRRVSESTPFSYGMGKVVGYGEGEYVSSWSEAITFRDLLIENLTRYM